MLPPALPRRDPPINSDPDEPIRSTDNDAASSRLSAANLGYFQDPFTALLHKPSPLAGPSRKPPLINIGTHHRTWALDRLVDDFFRCCGDEAAQVVSLGAGSDTRFWRLMNRDKPPNLAHYLELDFPSMTSLKAQRIARSPKLSSLLSPRPVSPQVDHQPLFFENTTNILPTTQILPSSQKQPYQVLHGGQGLTSLLYTLLPLDLRNQPLSSILSYLDQSRPTLFLAECVLCYMIPSEGNKVLEFFRENFSRCVGVIYEMCGLEDTFGKVMRRNLASRNLSLPGVYASPSTLAERLLIEGKFDRADGISLWQVRSIIPEEELKRSKYHENITFGTAGRSGRIEIGA
ncbi:hypothetical protein TREMEDRAFT_65596 [Tremella mesenterica DSM 1558]|uniref:uncharacterized protein n=1 Tax=Tremella mesenterica (strain ATCC 24925 / CBS 8224 / DSM 1558 / NBRC 9311 / NRRL Y-6157 / RJB 2259-6 / UBC 559-6) TaxID=578456 RepID=UPI00032CA2FF|nr:uncharacterized protein TREMEDRAFT_65596 [Tremella mesenterica DSM 1558]EIW66324.1 hypothetical protein TREMEDRAFT_65596 [Tremella mesenterica DSM 1558]